MADQTGSDINEVLFGGDAPESIDGQGGDDDIYGGGGGDDLRGGEGNDDIFGEGGNDAIRGGEGADLADGGQGNDTLYGLGEVTGAVPGNLLAPEDEQEIGADTLTGGSGQDVFYIQESGTGASGAIDKGFGFEENQQYAFITDFTAGEDKIRLPGGPSNYATSYYDSDGDGASDSTAIVYTEDPNVSFSIGLGPISMGGTRTLEIPDGIVAVAFVEGNTDEVQGLVNSDTYIYGSGTI